MPATLSEKPVPDRITKRRMTGERGYWIRGTTDADEAETVLLSGSPVNMLSSSGALLVRVDHEVRPLVEEGHHGGIWEGRVFYSAREVSPPPQVGDNVFNFEVASETMRITHSRQTIFATAPSGEAVPNMDGAINKQADGTIEGVEVPVGVMKFGMTLHIEHSFLVGSYGSVLGYAAVLKSLVGKVNNATYLGFAAGECMFLGASGGRRGSEGHWEISFQFAASENVDDVFEETPGKFADTVAKKGWEYVWVYHKQAVDEDAFEVVSEARAAYVEEVVGYANLALTGVS